MMRAPPTVRSTSVSLDRSVVRRAEFELVAVHVLPENRNTVFALARRAHRIEVRHVELGQPFHVLIDVLWADEECLSRQAFAQAGAWRQWIGAFHGAVVAALSDVLEIDD